MGSRASIVPGRGRDVPEPQEKPGALVEQRGDWLDESPVNHGRVILDELREVGRGQALWGKECRTEAEFIYLILSLHIDFLIPCPVKLRFSHFTTSCIINNTAIKTFVLHTPYLDLFQYGRIPRLN